jgi:hypothetical protein
MVGRLRGLTHIEGSYPKIMNLEEVRTPLIVTGIIFLQLCRLQEQCGVILL